MTETNANHTHLIDCFCSRPSSLCTLVSRKVKWFGHGGLHHRCVELGVASYRAREGGRTITCGLKTRLTELVVERILELWFRSACRCWRRIGGHLSPEFQADLSGLGHTMVPRVRLMFNCGTFVLGTPPNVAHPEAIIRCWTSLVFKLKQKSMVSQWYGCFSCSGPTQAFFTGLRNVNLGHYSWIGKRFVATCVPYCGGPIKPKNSQMTFQKGIKHFFKVSRTYSCPSGP